MQGILQGAPTWTRSNNGGFEITKTATNRFLLRRRNSSRRYSNHVSAVLSIPSPGAHPSNPPTVRQRSSLGEKLPGADVSHESPTTTSTDKPVFMELTTASKIRLSLSACGAILVWNAQGKSDRLVAQANLHLPSSCNGVSPVIVEQDSQEGRVVNAILRWGPDSSPLAELHVTALGEGISSPQDKSNVSNICSLCSFLCQLNNSCRTISKNLPLNDDVFLTAALSLSTLPSYFQSLTHGFSLDFRVSPTTGHSCAEIGVQLAPSGFWFGGGHFIRQMWPLNDAALEVGPWYAFDNGPNGVNTLLGTNWMTSNGLLLSVDPDTPFLHVGMNAPVAERSSWSPRKWGVGIQNATRELLPLTQDHGRVAREGCDGLLRIQARASYEDQGMQHPMREWRSQSSMSASLSSALQSLSSFDSSDSETVTANKDMLSIRMTLCATENAAEACKMALRTHTPPKQAPATEVLRDPIWTTWARYKTKVNQAKVLTYAHEICVRNLPRSVMEIDDRWQTAYGELSFDEKKFPDARGMVDELHDLGFKVTVWVHPFVEEKSSAFREGAARGYFVGSDAEGANSPSRFFGLLSGSSAPPVIPITPGGSAPGFFAWWNQPPVAALDVTNPEAVEWFVGRLKGLQAATGIDGFKFDAGEPCFLPRDPQTYLPLGTPADYTRLYVKNVAGQFAGGVSEVRTGHLTQDVALLTRMGDRFSTWDSGNGLRSLIPTLLTSGVLGYPFCLPDLVGGNRYFGAAPDAELLVRWTQASVLMPTLQFSIPPWDLNYEAERMVAGALEVRRSMQGLLLSLAEEAAQTLNPICRPLWMLAPDDEQTYEIHDQFALGDHVIVAPVVHKGAKQRDVYLTDGLWRDLKDPAKLVEGGRWLRGLSAPLDHLPVFVRDGTPGVFL